MPDNTSVRLQITLQSHIYNEIAKMTDPKRSGGARPGSGRKPKIPGQALRGGYYLRLSDSLRTWLEWQAQAQGLTVPELIRSILQDAEMKSRIV